MPWKISIDLIEAVKKGNVEYLLEKNITANYINQSIDEFGFTLLQIAIESMQDDVVTYLLNKGAETNVVSDNRLSIAPMHSAAKSNNIRAMSLLVEKGACINARDGRGLTPLHYAALYGQTEAVKFLVKGKNISINARAFDSSGGATALQLAINPQEPSFGFTSLGNTAKSFLKSDDIYNKIAVYLVQVGGADTEIKLKFKDNFYNALDYALRCSKFKIAEALEYLQRNQQQQNSLLLKRIEDLENKVKLLEQQLKNNNVNNNNSENSNNGQAQYLGKSITATITPTAKNPGNDATTILTSFSMST